MLFLEKKNYTLSLHNKNGTFNELIVFSLPHNTWIFLTNCTNWPQKLKQHLKFQTSWFDICGVSTNKKLVNGQTANEPIK